MHSMLQSADLDPENAMAVSGAADTLAIMQQWSRMEELLSSTRGRFGDNSDMASVAAMVPIFSRGDVARSRELYANVRPNVGENFVRATIDIPWFERDFDGVIEAWQRPEVRECMSLAGSTGYRELQLARAYRRLGEPERADPLLEKAAQKLANIDRDRLDPLVAFELDTLALVLALQGQNSRAIAIAEEATQLVSLQSDRLDGSWHAQNLCLVLALTGERDRALEILARMIDKPAGFNRWVLTLDPRWDFFRDDERFNDPIRPLSLVE